MDGLTGLPTYREVARHLQHGATPFGVVFDIDSLVWLTDMFGYQSSDEAIVKVGRLVQEVARQESGVTFRIGGDEFLVVLPEGYSHDRALAFARDVLRRVAELEIPYLRADNPSRRRLAVNAVVCRVSAGLTANVRSVREWIQDMIWTAKQGDVHRVEVIADAGETVPPWGLPGAWSD